MNRKSLSLKRRIALALVITLALVGLALGTGVVRAAVGDTAVVTAGQMNVRAGPGPGYPAIGTVFMGDVLTMQGRTFDSSWIKVQLPDGVTVGWVSTFYIKASTPVSDLPVLADSLPWGVITTAVVNVRTGPGTDFDVLTTVGQGTFVTVEGRNAAATWVKIMVEGVEGWVGSGHIALSVTLSSLPIATVEATPTPVGTASTATETPVPTEAPIVPMAVVKTGQLNVRSGPGAGYAIVSKLKLGDTVLLLGRNRTGSWLFVKLDDGTTGWVSSLYVIANVPVHTLPMLAEFVPTGIIIADTANFRAGPSLDAAVLATLNKGTLVSALGRTADSAWIQVTFNGVKGWVARSVIAINVPTAQLPVVSAAPTATPTLAPTP